MKTNKATLSIILLALIGLISAVSTSALAMNEDLVGAVVKTDQGVALSTDSGEYLVLDKDMKAFIGETVAVTGEVEDGVLTKTIHVTSVNVLTPKDIIDPSAKASGTKD